MHMEMIWRWGCP